MEIIKVFWGIRALLNKPFYKRVGNMSYMGKPILIMGKKNIEIGNKVRILPNIRMEVYGHGLIKIEDNCSIAQNVHITSKDDVLIIGKNTTILANSFITNIDHEYREIGKHIMEQPYLIKHTEIGENCFIGMGAAIQAGTVLGRQCIVGANSVVRGTFPDYCVIAGVPANIIKKYDPKTQEWERVDAIGIK